MRDPASSALLACAAWGLVCFSLTGCSHGSSSAREESGGNAGSEAVVAEVTLTRVATGDISQTLLLTGTIAALPNRDVRISSLVPGRIARMHVAEGDAVSRGQLLAQIDDRPFRDQLQQAEAAVELARANLENAKLARARNENLFERGIAARKELEDSRTQESVAAASLRQAEAALALARLQLSRTEVHAPLSGTVVKRSTSVGEQVDGTANQPIVEVANLSEVELFGFVPVTHLSQLRVGQQFAIVTDSFPGKTFQGRIVAISSAVEPSSNTGLMRIRISNPGGLLRLGMSLGAQIPIETHHGALVLPPQAIYRTPERQSQVYRVAGDQATAVPVNIGFEAQDRVELLSGVHTGDTVILTGGYGLPEKARIRVKGSQNP